ncbi:stage II sporulation protein E [Haloimpatiens lingqiaonensis]|uniref:stage II sporulation protein E n=1 Tax=Haloimpatiens lingqiaonensis TaxID=1380675 RepID=UPI0010FCFC1D|nr:stage II sporulation protein E [Haloimpatiens lingqiaonensis]
MQYGVNVFPYQRVSGVQKKEEVKKTLNANLIFKGVCIFFIALFISRVAIMESIAPFGIALLVAMLYYFEDYMFLIPCAGSVLGYVWIHNAVGEVGRYLIAISLIAMIFWLLKGISRGKKVIITFSIILLEFIMYQLFILKKPVGTTFLFCFLEMACIIPLYFIIDHSILCFKELNTKHLYSSEELITMAIFISLVLAGTYGIKIYKVSLWNVLSLTFISILTYVSGSGVGTATGVALGAIIGLGAKDISIYTCIYGLCALIAGAFREMGRWFTSFAFIVTFFIVTVYSRSFQNFKLIEPIVAVAIFLLIPRKFYEKLSLEVNREEKQKYISEEYINKIKKIFEKRLNSFSSVLDNMSETLGRLSKNENLSMKNKSTSLIENLADRVCSNCSMKGMCWNRELHYTYSAFGELIQNYQQGRKIIPKEIDKKCINKEVLLKNTEEIANNYVISELLNIRLQEGRKILSEQINNMAKSIKEATNDFAYGVRFNVALERDVIRILNKEKIKYEDITCFIDKNGRSVIKLAMKSCGNKQKCVKEILPLIDEVTGRSMCIEEEGCFIDANTGECTINFKEMPKYHISSYVKRKCKDGEEYNGDSYSFGKGNDGNYLMLLSDGMGSGPEASEESAAVVEMIENFMNSGFSEGTSIDAVNSIMSLKFYEEEKFSTVDLANVNLYTGEADFIKVGAASTFIKKANNVKVIESKSLPIGILDKVDVDLKKFNLQNGDIVVMLTDGVIDYNNENVGKNDWVIKYLEKSNSNNPREIAEGLMEQSLKLSKGKVRDDMTVMVSKVYDLY